MVTAPSARDPVNSSAKKRKAASVEAKPKESGCFLCMALIPYNLTNQVLPRAGLCVGCADNLIHGNLSNKCATSQYPCRVSGLYLCLSLASSPFPSDPDRKTKSSVTFFYNPKHDGPIVNGTTDKENDIFVGPTASFTNLWTAKGRALQAILADQVSSFQDMVAFTCSGKDALFPSEGQLLR